MIKGTLDEYAKTLEKKFSHDRTQSVGASEIGLCARKTCWTKKGGATKDEDFVQGWGAHMRGTIMEKAFWEPALQMKFGGSLLYAGRDQLTLERGNLSATPDGLVTDLPKDALSHLGVADIEGSCILVECKTIDPRVNLYKERESNHFQVQVQLGLVRELTEHKPTYALISYTDASFWDDVDEYPVKFDEAIYEAAKNRSDLIMATSNAADLKPEGWIAGGSECEYCPFTKACGIVRRSLPEREAAADPQFVAEVADMCRDFVSAKGEIESLEAETRDIQQKIKDRLREKSVRKIPGVVSWFPVKGRTSYDMKALKAAAAAAGVDVEQFSTAGEPTDSLRISVGRPSEPAAGE